MNGVVKLNDIKMKQKTCPLCGIFTARIMDYDVVMLTDYNLKVALTCPECDQEIESVEISLEDFK